MEYIVGFLLFFILVALKVGTVRLQQLAVEQWLHSCGH